MIGFYDMDYNDIGSICMDGAQELVVGTNGVVAQIQEKNPRVIGTRYVLHLQNFGSAGSSPYFSEAFSTLEDR